MSETDPCRASGVLLAQTAKTALVRIHTGHWTTDGPASEESEGRCPRDRPIREGLVVHHERVYRGEGLTVRSSEPLSSAAAISTSECANPTQNAGLKQHAIGSRRRRHAQSRAHTALLYSRGVQRFDPDAYPPQRCLRPASPEVQARASAIDRPRLRAATPVPARAGPGC